MKVFTKAKVSWLKLYSVTSLVADVSFESIEGEGKRMLNTRIEELIFTMQRRKALVTEAVRSPECKPNNLAVQEASNLIQMEVELASGVNCLFSYGVELHRSLRPLSWNPSC